MINFETPVSCNKYEFADTDKILFWMSNSYIFFPSCETCVNCGRCGKVTKLPKQN